MKTIHGPWRGAVRLALGILAGVLAMAPVALAQLATGSITGVVTDPSGAAVVGAKVTATNIAQGVSFTVVTNDSGVYNIPKLIPGTYEVKATATGFETVVHSSFNLTIGQVANLNFQMRVGAVSQTVKVTAGAPILQTQTTQVGTLINARTNVALPLASRNYIQLTLLAPGTTNPNPDTIRQQQLMPSSGRPYINGNREQANAFLIDGIESTEDNNNEIGYQPQPDAIQEFNLITQNDPAQYGNYAGGVVISTIKSGTNEFHGDVFEFLRNDKLDANSWANDIQSDYNNRTNNGLGVVKKAALRWNEFGGTIGGPIIKNKLFFFGDYEGFRNDTPQTTVGYSVFTDAMKAGNFGILCPGGFTNSGTTCSGGTQLVDPSTKQPIPYDNMANDPNVSESSVAQALFASKFYPTASIQNPGGVSQANFFGQVGSQINDNQGDLRIDYTISNNDRLFGRYSEMRLTNPFTATYLLGSAASENTETARNSVLDWTHMFGSTVVNDARLGFNYILYNQGPPVSNGTLGNLGALVGINGGNANGPGMPEIDFIDQSSVGNRTLIQNFGTTEIVAEDSLTLTRGVHTLDLGFQFWRFRENYNYSGNDGILGHFSPTSITGSDLADFWLGMVGTGSGRGAPPQEFGMRGNMIGAYLQDNWRTTPTLTLNLGLRFELHTPFYEVRNRQVNFGLYSGAIELAGVNGNSRALYNSYHGIGDYQPRIGLAWSPAALEGKTVFRGSYGISSYLEGTGANQAMTLNPPFSGATAAITSLADIANGFPSPTSTCTVVQVESSTGYQCFQGTNLRVWDPNFRPALVQQYNVTIQHQFSDSTTLQVGYVGQYATHLLNLMDYSQQRLVTPAQYSSFGPGATMTAPAVIAPSPYLAGNPNLDQYFGPNGNWIWGSATNGKARYDSLQVVLQKHMSNGLQGQVAYTYSKCMSNSGGYYGTWGDTQTSHGVVGWQNVYDPQGDWGPCYYDTTHNLSSYFIYDLPFGHGRQFGKSMNSLEDGVIGGWSLSGLVALHTGFAMTTTNAWWDPSGTGGLGGAFEDQRLSCLGPVQYDHSSVAGGPGIQWFSGGSFMSPLAGTFGNCGVGDLRGPGYADLDLALRKRFPIGEGRRIEFRTEFLNAFNHPILDAPNVACSGGYSPGVLCPSTSGSGGFGSITGSSGERNIQFALKLYF